MLRTLSAEMNFDESQLAGARLAKGSIIRAAIAGDDLTYEADATIAGLDLQRVGSDFNVAALAEDRLRSQLTTENSGGDPFRRDRIGETSRISDQENARRAK